MTKKVSFTKYENEILPDFRQKLNMAESTEDVKKFFIYTIKELFESAFPDQSDLEYDDIVLTPEREPNFKVSSRLRASKEFSTVWRDSDLSHVIGRLAKSALNRCKRLEKHPEKTDAKIRM